MVWFAALMVASFGIGYVAGEITRCIVEERKRLKNEAEVREKQAYIRRLMNERKSLIWQNKIGRAL